MTVVRRGVQIVAIGPLVLLGGGFSASAATVTATTAGARLAAARLALDSGRPDDASKILGAPAGPLRDYEAVLLAEANMAKDRPARAREALSGIGRAPPETNPCKPDCMHPLWIVAQRLVAATHASNDPARAAGIVAELPATGADLAAAVLLYRQAEDAVRATEIERRMLVEVPWSREARALAARLGAEAVVVRLSDPAMRLARIRALLAAHLNDEARREARAALDAGHPSRCELLYVRGKAERKLRRYKGAVTALAQAKKACLAAGEEDLGLRSSLLEVRVRAIRGQVAATRRAVEALARRAPKHRFTDDALMMLADLFDRRGRRADADATYRRILKDHAQGDKAAVAAWRLAFAKIKKGKLAAARPWLEQIAESEAGERDAARAHYWLGRSLESTDTSSAAARSHFIAAVNDPPLSFYAHLALDRLRRDDPEEGARLEAGLIAALTAPWRDRPVAAIDGDAPAAVRAQALHAIGWSDAAAAELGLLESKDASERAVVELALSYDRVGAHQRAQWLLRTRARQALARPPSGWRRAVWLAAFSRPFSDLLTAAATAEKVEPLFLYALCREESTFDPRIVSWAGATGLTQLMPATAVGAYAEVFGGRIDMARLTDPELNLRLGAHVMRQGLRRFGGIEALGLAAYNGGPGLARRTMGPRAVDFDVWVETIPVRETRRYVKKVLGTWGTYRLLYDPDRPFIRLPARIPARRSKG